MSLDRPTCSIRLLQTDTTSEDRRRDKRRSSNATDWTSNDKTLNGNVHLSSFRRKFITEHTLAGLNCFLVWPSWLVRRVLSSTFRLLLLLLSSLLRLWWPEPSYAIYSCSLPLPSLHPCRHFMPPEFREVLRYTYFWYTCIFNLVLFVVGMNF